MTSVRSSMGAKVFAVPACTLSGVHSYDKMRVPMSMVLSARAENAGQVPALPATAVSLGALKILQAPGQFVLPGQASVLVYTMTSRKGVLFARAPGPQT